MKLTEEQKAGRAVKREAKFQQELELDAAMRVSAIGVKP